MDEAGKQIAGDFRNWEGDAAARAFFTSKPSFDRDAGVFYDPLVPEEKLVILGAGHVGLALALAAAPLGFQITVVDDRAELLGPDRSLLRSTRSTAISPSCSRNCPSTPRLTS